MSIEYNKELAEVYLDFTRSLFDDEKLMSENHQKATVWIVSLSTASIGLLITQTEKLVNINQIIISATIALLVLSILCSLSSRVVAIFLIRRTFHVLRALEMQILFKRVHLKLNDSLFKEHEGEDPNVQVLKDYDILIGKSLGFSEDEWEERKLKYKLIKGPRREKLFKIVNVFYWLGILLFMLAITLLATGYIF